MMMPGVWIMLYYNNKGGGWYGRDPYFLTIGREVVGSATTNGVSHSFWCFHVFICVSLVFLTLVCFSPRSFMFAQELPEILWSQPEIAVYDREYRGGTSGGGYPDFIFVNATGTMNPTTTTPAPPSVYITTAQKGLPHPAKSRSYLILFTR